MPMWMWKKKPQAAPTALVEAVLAEVALVAADLVVMALVEAVPEVKAPAAVALAETDTLHYDSFDAGPLTGPGIAKNTERP